MIYPDKICKYRRNDVHLRYKDYHMINWKVICFMHILLSDYRGILVSFKK